MEFLIRRKRNAFSASFVRSGKKSHNIGTQPTTVNHLIMKNAEKKSDKFI